MKFRLIYSAPGLLLLGALLILSACSQEKNTLLSKSWHNLNARDNAYFLARDRTKEIEAEIDAKTQSDYNKILFPITIIDTNETKAYKEKTDDIIKKASLPITKHKNSNYVDDSYILVGKSRVLRGEWKLATETFKYVNAKGVGEERYEGLIQLMRLFMLKKDFRSAGYVMDFLEKQTITSKKNIRDFALSKAQFNRYNDNYLPMAEQIEKAIPLVTGRKEKKARLYFILGQIYQYYGKDSVAYINYKSTIKNNPPYELSFYAKLYLAQVTALHDASATKKTERYFKKLLKDKKNLEYKDKIYYEMALFKYKQKNYPGAISYLEKSVYENRSNKYQKGASYLKLGEIYYGDLKNFEMAKLYYDSTVSVWSRDDKQYREISDRQKVLAEFVENLLVVRREDSLQRLAKMDSMALSKFIDGVIEKENQERILKEKQLAAAQKRANEIKSGPQVVDNTFNPADASAWYFYNAVAVSRGATDFKNKWGNRKLEDNWRRKDKEEQFANAEEEDTTANSEGEEKNNRKETVEAKVDKTPYYKDIPYTDEQLKASHLKIQEALFNLGKIYNLKLNEKEEAIKTFEDLLRRYPTYENTAEVLYYLHLLNKDVKNDERAQYYKDKLIAEYPRTIYAKMLLNPNYLQDSKIENKLVASLYRDAYNRYEKNDFIAADSMLVTIMKEHPDNDILDKLKFLRILITGKTKNALVYQAQLKAFIEDKNNEFSTLLPKAKELLGNAEMYLQEQTKGGKEVKASDVRYNTNTSKPHYYVAVFDSRKSKLSVIQKQMNDYNNNYYKGQELAVETFKNSDSTFVVVVKTFEAMYPSKQYREAIGSPIKMNKPFAGSIIQSFYITDANYLLFYKDKNVNTYMEFFKNNY